MKRRNFLKNSAIGVGIIATTAPTFTFAEENAFKKEYRRATNGKITIKNSKLVKLSAPEIAENGKVVPVRVEAMGIDAYEVDSIHVVCTKNFQPKVISATFSKYSKEAFVATRMKLSGTQDIIGIVVLKNGKVYENRKNTKVTIGGCG